MKAPRARWILVASTLLSASLVTVGLTDAAGSEPGAKLSHSCPHAANGEIITMDECLRRTVAAEEDRAATCLKGQHAGTTVGEPNPGYVEGPDSPRTPADALAEADVSVGISMKRVGGGESRRYVGRNANGRPRVINELSGGAPGGGWIVMSSTVCADPPK